MVTVDGRPDPGFPLPGLHELQHGHLRGSVLHGHPIRQETYSIFPRGLPSLRCAGFFMEEKYFFGVTQSSPKEFSLLIKNLLRLCFIKSILHYILHLFLDCFLFMV